MKSRDVVALFSDVLTMLSGTMSRVVMSCDVAVISCDGLVSVVISCDVVVISCDLAAALDTIDVQSSVLLCVVSPGVSVVTAVVT